MRVGFVTCVRLGCETLVQIMSQGVQVSGVVTLPQDVSVGKSGRAFPHALAKRGGAPLHETKSINSPETVEWIGSLDLDWLFIIGWSQIASDEVLQLPRLGCLGMHPTLLPVGRGRASIPWAIIKGLPETGVTLFKLDGGVDSGPILDQERISVHPLETASSLYQKVESAHRTLAARNIGAIMDGTAEFRPQDDGQAEYWPGRTPADGRVTSDLGVEDVDALVRALAPPYPPASWVDPEGRAWHLHAGGAGDDLPGLRIAARDGIYTATAFAPID